MNLNIYLPLLVCVLGGVGYGWLFGPDKHPRAWEMSRILFWTGALAFMLTFPAGASFSIHR